MFGKYHKRHFKVFRSLNIRRSCHTYNLQGHILQQNWAPAVFGKNTHLHVNFNVVVSRGTYVIILERMKFLFDVTAIITLHTPLKALPQYERYFILNMISIFPRKGPSFLHNSTECRMSLAIFFFMS